MTTLPAIRTAGHDDLTAMAAVINPIIRAGGTTAFETELSPAELAMLTLDDPLLICCFVALDGAGQVAGFQYLARTNALPADVADIATFARISPKLPGVGRALLARTVAAARAEGLTAINARIRADNDSGLGFYSKMGFHDYSVTEGVPLADGTPVDRISKRMVL